MNQKRGPERLTSRGIAKALESTPANRAILDDKPTKTSLGHWKAKLVESGLFGEMKDGEDPRTFYANLSKEVDDFLKRLFAKLRTAGGLEAELDDGRLNLDFEFNDTKMAGHLDSKMTEMFSGELEKQAMVQYNLNNISVKIREARQNKTFRELRRAIVEVVPKEVMDMKLYGKDTRLGTELLNGVLPNVYFDVGFKSEDFFGGEDEFGNEVLETDVSDEDLAEIDTALKDLISANYTYREMAHERSQKILSLVFPDAEERARVLGTIGIEEQ